MRLLYIGWLAGWLVDWIGIELLNNLKAKGDEKKNDQEQTLRLVS